MFPRLEKAIYHIDLLVNLSSANYENTPAEAQDMIDRLEEAVDRVRQAFNLPAIQESIVDVDLAELEARVEPDPEPEPTDVPEEVRQRNEGPFVRGWAAWALDIMNTDPKAAREFLTRALKGVAY